MKKKSHKGKGKTEQVKKAELQSWVRPNKTAAKYWTFLIGQVQHVVSGKGQHAVVRVRFQYRIDGSRLSKDEYMDFLSSKLTIVKDFAARIKKANPPMIPTPADEYEIVEPLVEPEPGPIIVPPSKTLKLSGRKVVLDSVPPTATPEEAAEIVKENQSRLAEVAQPIEVPRDSAPPAPLVDFLDKRRDNLRQRFKALSDLTLNHNNVALEDKSTP